MAEIRVISTCLVQGAAVADNSFSSNRIDLTPWDLQLLLLDSIQKGLLLHKPTIEQEQKLLGSNVIDHLKNSLSKTLYLFPPLAGRLGTQKNDDNSVSFFVDCNNLGAQFTHVIAQGVTMADILEPRYVPSIVHSFFSLNRVPNCEGISKPLLCVQVTELVDGFFIGCSMNHSVADGTSFWKFFNSWSEICRGSDVVSNPPVFRPWFPDDASRPIRIPSWDEQVLDEFVPPVSLERVFHFTKEGLAKLKARANSEVVSNKISTLQAVLAHLWRTFARCRNLDGEEEISLVLIIGARPRLQPPLPKGHFGNAVYLVTVRTTAGELLKNGVGWAALQINEHVALQTSEEVKTWYADWIKNPMIPKKSGAQRNNLVISSSPLFNMYGNDFGWGKPVAVRSGVGNKYQGKITLFSGAKDGDIDIEACLSPETLHAMGKDAEFMEAVTIQESTVYG